MSFSLELIAHVLPSASVTVPDFACDQIGIRRQDRHADWRWLIQALVALKHRNAITKPPTKLYPQPVTRWIGHRARQNLSVLGFADSGDECMRGNDEIARSTCIASLAKTGERVMAQAYDAAARAFRFGVRPTDDPNMLHV